MLGIAALAPMQLAHASCILDNDWPEKPCLDTPPYSESYLKSVWEEYYNCKGGEWMETKKAEMDQAIKDGTLREWVEYSSEPINFANYNVYSYYHMNGQAPDAYAGASIDTNYKPVISYWYVSRAGWP